MDARVAIEKAPVVTTKNRNIRPWLAILSNTVLNKKGKALVSTDPNITEPTKEQLLGMIEQPEPEIKFHFGEDRYGEENDISSTVLSMCIKDNLNQSLCELAANYAGTRNIPFILSYMAIKELYMTRGLFYYDDTDMLIGIVRRNWAPKEELVFVPPPRKKKYRRAKVIKDVK